MLPGVDPLLDLRAEVLEHAVQVPIEMPNTSKSVIDTSAGASGGREVNLDLRVVEKEDRLVVVPDAGLPRSPHDLHVLIRHRLLRKPGGFEGPSVFCS